ncbi:MAG: hypothetical protein M1617_04090 [Actinobacteria bacterium]|nr:hypothetical protein [Actinomycetota bacterium]
MKQMRAAVIGEDISAGAFRSLGFEVFPAAIPEQAREAWTALDIDEYAVILVTERVYEGVKDLVAAIAGNPLPAVTVISGTGGRGGVGQDRIDRAIEKALGTAVSIREEAG